MLGYDTDVLLFFELSRGSDAVRSITRLGRRHLHLVHETHLSLALLRQMMTELVLVDLEGAGKFSSNDLAAELIEASTLVGYRSYLLCSFQQILNHRIAGNVKVVAVLRACGAEPQTVEIVEATGPCEAVGEAIV